MVDMKEIYDFSIKWLDKFHDRNIDYKELVGASLGEDCAALGFKIDFGSDFLKKYGKFEKLSKVIEGVKDISLLGSAIYSQWRYFNHWALYPKSILEAHNIAWFILALGHLAILSRYNLFYFEGKLKKLCIRSKKNFKFLGNEIEQNLSIDDEGYVHFSTYNLENKIRKSRVKNFKIEKEASDKLLNIFSIFFSNEYDEIVRMDSGNWMMELYNAEGKIYRFQGSLYTYFDYQGMDLSDLVRNTLGMDDLYVFDANYKADEINKITLEYHKIQKIEIPKILDKESRCIIWDYTESLIIDRETETIEHIQNIGTGCKVTHKYEIEDGIEILLEDLDAEDFFTYVEGNPNDVIETSKEKKDYRITIDYKRKSQRIIEGSYDKKALPMDFPNFIERVFEFIQFYGRGEIFNPSIYGKIKRRKSEYIFCSVSFNKDEYKTYYYLTDDDSVNVGDFVIVPAGKDNHEVCVKVVDIEYFTEENFPLPLKKIKKIIRKY